MNPVDKYDIANLVLPLDSVIKTNQEETLGSALSKIESSHSAIFIFDRDNKFLGLISPQKTLYSNNYPYDTKVGSILLRPPTITKSTPIYVIAEHMLSTRIYTLPVFADNETVQGAIFAKDILRYIIEDKVLLRFISKTIIPRKPITAHKNSTVKDVYQKMKKNEISRIILVDDEGDLAGIVSRSDLMHAFIEPSVGRRFAREGTYPGFYSLAGEKKFRQENPALTYATLLVESISSTTPMEEIVSQLIKRPHNSIVLVNKNSKPTGFISTRDLLQTVSTSRPEKEVQLIIKKPTDSVSQRELELAEKHLTQFGNKLKKRMAIKRIEVAAEEPKNRKGETREFNTTLIIIPVAGKSLVAVTKQRRFIDSVQEATTIIEKQRRQKRINTNGTLQSFY